MHGQNRAEYKARQRDATLSAGLNQKARQWHTLTSELISRRQTQNPADSASLLDNLRLTEKLLTVNPDPIYLWNLRRETITQSSSIYDTTIKFIGDENSLTASCLKRNPKAYGAWFHRKWCIRHFILIEAKTYFSTITYDNNLFESERKELLERWTRLLDQELDLCSEFLKYDERNFHCWNYRRFIVSTTATVLATKTLFISNENQTFIPILQKHLDGSWWWRSLCPATCTEYDTFSYRTSVPGAQICPPNEFQGIDTPILVLSEEDEEKLINKEWKFTEEKINQNFSNCSAFHYRSILLPYLLVFLCRKGQTLDNNLGHVEERRGEKALELITNELDITHNAIFTEPDDQSAWWYYRFLIKWAYNHVLDNRKSLESFEILLCAEQEILSDLIETENNNCKWGHLCLQMLKKISCSKDK